MLTRAFNWQLLCTKLIQFIPSPPIYLRVVLILSYHLHLGHLMVSRLAFPQNLVCNHLLSLSVSQEFPHILWKTMFYYRVNKSPQLVPILHEIDPVHSISSYFSKIHFSIILPLTSRSPNGVVTSGFPTKFSMHSSFI
jgi:hypothetical protein